MATFADYGKIEGKQIDFSDEQYVEYNKVNLSQGYGHYFGGGVQAGNAPQNATAFFRLNLLDQLKIVSNLTNSQLSSYTYTLEVWSKSYSNDVLSSDLLIASEVGSYSFPFKILEPTDHTLQIPRGSFSSSEQYRIIYTIHNSATLLDTWETNLFYSSIRLNTNKIQFTPIQPYLNGSQLEVILDGSCTYDHDIASFSLLSNIADDEQNFETSVFVRNATASGTTITNHWQNVAQTFQLWVINKDGESYKLDEFDYTP